MPLFRFYFPSVTSERLPADLVEFAYWFEGQARTANLLGPAAWVVQTYLHMRQLGLPCELTAQWPEDGVVVAHRDHLPDTWAQRPQRYVVCCLADRMLPHPYADLHVLQNPYQRLRFGAHVYVPHWPQPGLRPRDAGRGAKMENLAFFGEVGNLAPALRAPEFSAWCRQQGMRFSIPSRDAWADYRRVDVVIAVRQFSSEWSAFDKPATKLFNAWQAGAVPILGKESAYAAEGRHGENCILVSDLSGLKDWLLELRADAPLVRKLLEAGTEALAHRSQQAVAEHWARVLGQQIAPAAVRQRALGPLYAVPASAWARFKAGLAWRGRLLAHRGPPAATPITAVSAEAREHRPMKVSAMANGLPSGVKLAASHPREPPGTALK